VKGALEEEVEYAARLMEEAYQAYEALQSPQSRWAKWFQNFMPGATPSRESMGMPESQEEEPPISAKERKRLEKMGAEIREDGSVWYKGKRFKRTGSNARSSKPFMQGYLSRPQGWGG
jgi:hypothetical protein